MNTNKTNISHNKKESYLFDFIQEHASIGTWEYDPNLHTVNWSSQTKKLHGVSQDYEPTVEQGLNFYKTGDSLNLISKAFTDCIEKHKAYDVEVQIVTATGKDKWVRVIGTPIVENNECIKVQGLFQDIDEKTRTARALAYKEQLLRKTFETALVGMAILDLNGTWIDVNQSLCDMLGYSKKELKQLTFQDITHPKDVEQGRQAMKELLNGDIDNFQTEKSYIHKKGKVIPALLSTTIIKHRNEKPSHFVAQISDLSEIEKKSKKVSKLLATTENQNKRLLNFAHIVSHNLRSHYGNLDMLLDIVKMDLPETTENEIFPLIELAVDQLGETVGHLNEVATINIQKDLKTEPINVLDSLNKALSNISALILQSKTKISIHIDPQLYIEGVPAYVDSIVLNFLTNAIKYKKPNEPAKIDINFDMENDFVILKIKDYGQGIDLNKYGESLFGMYKTFHKHKDARGIGLFITKNQIEAIGGKIEVKSQVNEGTTFYIHLKKHISD
ncbi:PAS domain-containing sensor histidine kinase [Winogradskyella sp. SM1960]|uniref:PAS domain-containing sensor histidine kinase n=1 Tax=Winogradskyella sp. SM1960 TaxID=2865955 RepID=UPI001CD2E393|nr:PAS domain-containing sensor histidine kinase [Winogradskyella sp. SM1960]